MSILLPHRQYPMLSERLDTPFVQEMISGPTISVNGNPMKKAVWNLIVSHSHLQLWCAKGIKPNRHWKVSDVKKYFGLKGSKKKLLADFEKLKAEVM
jgi:hypothetical protein